MLRWACGQEVHGPRPGVSNSLHLVFPGGLPAYRVLHGTRYRISECGPGRRNTVMVDTGAH